MVAISKKNTLLSTIILGAIILSTSTFHCAKKGVTPGLPVIAPIVVTEPVKYDTDDPAIWVNPLDPAASLIIGTDKDEDGGLYVYDLQGKIIAEKTVYPLQRPNNVDVEYGLMLDGKPVDIAVTTERFTDKIRIFTLPDMQAVDGGGIEVFVGETLRAPMGIALYKRPADGAVFAVVGRKDGPRDGRYLWQYLLQDDGTGQVKAEKVREFGFYSGRKEIEAIAVDDELGYVYCSDEGVGVRKYAADPDAPAANEELALFATEGFADDHEGIALYNVDDKTGYILVSDQGADEFHIYKREGEPDRPHQHNLVKVVRLSTQESDGCDAVSVPLNDRFPQGLFVAMSTDRTFHYYSWADIAGEELSSHAINAPSLPE